MWPQSSFGHRPVQLAADSKGIHLSHTSPSVRHTVGDSSRLQQLFGNLLANAIKFTPSGGRVEVRVERANAALQVCVSDTGQGISAEFLPFIFDRLPSSRLHLYARSRRSWLGPRYRKAFGDLHGGSVQATVQDRKSALVHDQAALTVITNRQRPGRRGRRIPGQLRIPSDSLNQFAPWRMSACWWWTTIGITFNYWPRCLAAQGQSTNRNFSCGSAATA